MSRFWYNAFITQSQSYVLLDGEGCIRASAPDIEGITLAKIKYGWGDVHKLTFKNKKLTIGAKVE